MKLFMKFDSHIAYNVIIEIREMTIIKVKPIH